MCFGDAIFSDVSASEEVDDVLRIFMSRLSTLKYSFLPPMSLETGWVALLSRFRECDCLLMSFFCLLIQFSFLLEPQNSQHSWL